MILHKNLLTRQRDHYILTKCLFMKKPLAGLLGKLLHKKKKTKKKLRGAQVLHSETSLE